MAFISQEKIFYGASSFLGILAIIYFGFEYLVALSPFTISIILFSVFATFLGLGLRSGGNTSVLAYVFSAGSYLVALFYTMGRFGFSSDGIMVSLIASSGIFAGLGYLVTQKEFSPTNNQVKKTITALLILVAGLILYDVGSGNISYDYELESEVEISESIDAGDLIVSKSSLLPYDSDGVSFSGCLYNETGDRQRAGSFFRSEIDTMKFGNLEETEDITFEFDMERVNIQGTVPVEEQEAEGCPREVDGAKLIVDSNLGSGELLRRSYD